MTIERAIEIACEIAAHCRKSALGVRQAQAEALELLLRQVHTSERDHAAMQAMRDYGVYVVPVGFVSNRIWEKAWRDRDINGHDIDDETYKDPAECLIAAAKAIEGA